ncbi:hypothetical protein [Flavobacterium sp. N1994]|uniref:hypothetical protein n=1 Tax=Flavobacterium sp. N1994 TaxID=2986827 RepID=UPI002223B3DE|nr:hypothetical protein [Flavobacterium sp. N1994]
MKYRKKLLELIFDENENAMLEWLEAQPILEQPDILRELKELSEEIANENGDDISEMVEGYDTFDEKIDLYEDAVLDEKQAEANLVMAQEELDKKMLEIDEAVIGVREYIMDCIVNNEDNADAMRELAEKIMQSEKDNDIFDPKNWSRIL